MSQCQVTTTNQKVAFDLQAPAEFLGMPGCELAVPWLCSAFASSKSESNAGELSGNVHQRHWRHYLGIGVWGRFTRIPLLFL